MISDEPTEDTLIRLLIDSWVAARAGTLDPRHREALDRERPQWQCEAATLIAEGILSYVMVEMVEPDLAQNASSDRHTHDDPEDVAARLGAHMMDFVDYRSDLERVAHGTGHKRRSRDDKRPNAP